MCITQTYQQIRLFFIVLLSGLLPAIPAVAQVTSGNRLGVSEAIGLAQSRNPAINHVREALQIKNGEWWSSFGISTPEISYFREGIPSTAAGEFVEQRWMISQTIDFPLQSYYRLRRVDTEQDALMLGIDAEAARLKSAVKRAYTDLLYTQEVVHLREQEVSLAQQLQEAATVRVEVGEASELEVMKADIQLSEALSRQEEAWRQFENARYTLFNIVGLDPDNQRYDIAFPDTLVYIDVNIDQAQILSRLNLQPEFLSASRNLDAARFGIKQTRSTLLPAITFDYYGQDYGLGFDQYGFQVGLKLPLWVFPNYKGALRQAKARAQTHVWQRESVHLAIKKQAEQAWHGYQTSKRTIDRYRTTVLTRSDELLQRTLEGYRIGELDLLTLLDTQRTYLTSQLRFYDALRDYYFQLIELEKLLDEDMVFNPAYEQLQYSELPKSKQ